MCAVPHCWSGMRTSNARPYGLVRCREKKKASLYAREALVCARYRCGVALGCFGAVKLFKGNGAVLDLNAHTVALLEASLQHGG